MALLFLLGLAVQSASTNAALIQDKAQERCKAALARKLNAEITDFKAADFKRIGRHDTVTGTVTALKRANARPGEMSPNHVIRARYSYTCRVGGHALPHIRLTPLPD